MVSTIPQPAASRSISSGRVRKPYPLALRLLIMSETAATVWERSALGKASVSWPSWSKVTPPGPTPCNMRRWITSVGGRPQSQAITDQPTHLIPDRTRPAPHEVRVGERMVANLVLRSDLGSEVGLAPDVVAYLEEGSPDAFAVEDLEQVPRVGMTGAVVEGHGDHPLAGTSVPEDRAVEPGAGREAFVGHEPAGRHPGPGRGQGKYGTYRVSSHGSKTSQGRTTDGGGGDGIPGVGAGMSQGRPASMREAAERAEWGLWAAFAASTILCLRSGLVRILSVWPRICDVSRTMTPAP